MGTFLALIISVIFIMSSDFDIEQHLELKYPSHTFEGINSVFIISMLHFFAQIE